MLNKFGAICWNQPVCVLMCSWLNDLSMLSIISVHIFCFHDCVFTTSAVPVVWVRAPRCPWTSPSAHRVYRLYSAHLHVHPSTDDRIALVFWLGFGSAGCSRNPQYSLSRRLPTSSTKIEGFHQKATAKRKLHYKASIVRSLIFTPRVQ